LSEGHARLVRWSDVPREALTATVARRVITAERMMVAQLYLEAGAVIAKHAHENEQITYVLEGRMRFWLGEHEPEVIEIAAGEVSDELRRRGISSDERVTLMIASEQEWIPGRRASRARVVAAGLTDDDIDRLIKQAQREVEPPRE